MVGFIRISSQGYSIFYLRVFDLGYKRLNGGLIA